MRIISGKVRTVMKKRIGLNKRKFRNIVKILLVFTLASILWWHNQQKEATISAHPTESITIDRGTTDALEIDKDSVGLHEQNLPSDYSNYVQNIGLKSSLQKEFMTSLSFNAPSFNGNVVKLSNGKFATVVQVRSDGYAPAFLYQSYLVSFEADGRISKILNIASGSTSFTFTTSDATADKIAAWNANYLIYENGKLKVYYLGQAQNDSSLSAFRSLQVDENLSNPVYSSTREKFASKLDSKGNVIEDEPANVSHDIFVKDIISSSNWRTGHVYFSYSENQREVEFPLEKLDVATDTKLETRRLRVPKINTINSDMQHATAGVVAVTFENILECKDGGIVANAYTVNPNAPSDSTRKTQYHIIKFGKDGNLKWLKTSDFYYRLQKKYQQKNL